MKSRLLLAALLSVIFLSCRDNKDDKVNKVSNNEPISNYEYNKLEGVYEGDFGGSGNIKVVLRHVTGTHAVGYNLHKGLRRNISGKMSPAENGFSFQLLEPGDNPYDGEFNFKIDTVTLKLSGSWKPAHNNKLTAKDYVLGRLPGTDEVNADDFDIYGIMYDTLGGEFHFEKSGLCIYRYYEDKNDETATQQYKEVKGNWKKTATEYIIEWQKNDVFTHPVSTLKIVNYPDAQYYYLEGEGRKIEPQLAG